MPAPTRKAQKENSHELTVKVIQQSLSLIPPIFSQAQQSLASHKKNIVAIRKIQVQCAKLIEEHPNGRSIKLIGEKAFNAMFIDMVGRVLTVKKGVTVADRIVQFVGKYVAYTTEQDATEGDGDDQEDTVASRFVSKLVKHLLSGFEAKDKNVRYRVVQIVVALINGIGEIDDDLYVALRSSLLERSKDKEASVRVQAALGLAKLQSGEDDDDLEEGQESLEQVLLDMLRFDPAPEVRRAALYNITLSPHTLPHILSRTRDVDATLRRVVFYGSLSSANIPDPRLLTQEQRHEIVKNGLGDREMPVRKAAAGMLGGWLESEGVNGDLAEFLKRFDVVNGNVAEDALLSLFVSKPAVADQLNFDEAFWTELTPEKALLVRVFVDHCQSIKDTTRLENILPEVTALAFWLQEQFNDVLDIAEKLEEKEDDDDLLDQLESKAFIINELCKLALDLDYADEVGRRKTFQLAREMISHRNLPQSLIAPCLDVLSKISTSERDLIRIIVDVVTELRSTYTEAREDDSMTDSQGVSLDETPRSPRKSTVNMEDPEVRLSALVTDLRCLYICTTLLQNVNNSFSDNSVFQGIIDDLILPSVRSKEAIELREHGLVCLGMCAILDIKLASSSMPLLVGQLDGAEDEDMRVKVAQILFDLLMVHDAEKLLGQEDRMLPLLIHVLGTEQPEIQAVACEGVAKLMLAGMVYDDVILQELVFRYLSPDTVDNPELRQCLSYFFPVYCYSAARNQRRMQKLFIPLFESLAEAARDADGGDEMLPISQIGLLLVDWTDPSKMVEREGVEMDLSGHIDVATDTVKALCLSTDRDLRKALIGLLSKLYLPDEVEDIKIQSLLLLLTTLRSRRPPSDASSRNSLSRFENNLLKKYAEQLEHIDDVALREVEDLREVFEFIDEVEEESEDGASQAGSAAPSVTSRASSARPAARARRSAVKPIADISEAEEGDCDDDGEDSTVAGNDETADDMSVATDDDDVDSMLDDE